MDRMGQVSILFITTDTMLNFHMKGESDVMCKQTLSIT